MYTFECSNFFILRFCYLFLMGEKTLGECVANIVSGLPDPFPYCIYVHGGDEDFRRDVASLVGSRTSSLVVEVSPRCDYYDVNLDWLKGVRDF